MSQMYPLPNCGSKRTIVAGWTVEVAGASFLKWFICVVKLWLVSMKSVILRHRDGNSGLSFFNFKFVIGEIRLLMKPTQ